MAGLARRLAPAAALGGLAVIIVGVADPAIAGRGQEPVVEPAAAPSQESAADQPTSDQSTSDQSTAEQPTTTTVDDCSAGDTVTGDSVMTRWGPVQVAATVSGSRICEVHAVAWPDGDRKSAQINAYAIPTLDQTATASEGTQLDYVSGATYTSDAYAQSLQSILDAL